MTKQEIISELQTRASNGHTRAKLEAYLLLEHDCSVNESKALCKEALGSGASRTVDLSEVVAYVRANYGTLSKKELIAGMCEVTGGTYSSENHRYNYIKFAIEFAKQEVEASK